MKMFWVVYDDYFDDSITNAFKQAGCKSYMKLHDATGVSHTSGVTVGTHKRPAKSILMAVPDESIPRLLEIVRGLKTAHPTMSCRAVTFPLEECIL